MQKFFKDEYGNVIQAYDNLLSMKQAMLAEEPTGRTPDSFNEGDDVWDIHSGILNNKRYYGYGGYGVEIDSIEALDNFSDWWEPEWDSEVYD